MYTVEVVGFLDHHIVRFVVLLLSLFFPLDLGNFFLDRAYITHI
jgi:hypothetical protein